MPRAIATVDVPSSSANLGSGFDAFAVALSLKLRAELFPEVVTAYSLSELAITAMVSVTLAVIALILATGRHGSRRD